MDVTLDRDFLKKGTVGKFPNQPGLVQMTSVALEQLAKNPEGFFLMVEGASIDKMSHPMDWDRAFFETIEFDKAIGLGIEFAKTHPDTLIVVTGDHTHGVSIIGTVDDEKPGTEMREKVGTYADAGFPNYEDKDGDGYPDKVDVTRRLATFSNNYPDYYETFRPKLDGPFEPAVQNEKKEYVANEKYKSVPGAVFREGNMPRSADSAVHAVDDVVLQATGPGAEEFKGYMEESDVYRVLVDALAIAPPGDELSTGVTLDDRHPRPCAGDLESRQCIRCRDGRHKPGRDGLRDGSSPSPRRGEGRGEGWSVNWPR